MLFVSKYQSNAAVDTRCSNHPTAQIPVVMTKMIVIVLTSPLILSQIFCAGQLASSWSLCTRSASSAANPRLII